MTVCSSCRCEWQQGWCPVTVPCGFSSSFTDFPSLNRVQLDLQVLLLFPVVWSTLSTVSLVSDSAQFGQNSLLLSFCLRPKTYLFSLRRKNHPSCLLELIIAFWYVIFFFSLQQSSEHITGAFKVFQAVTFELSWNYLPKSILAWFCQLLAVWPRAKRT